MLASPFHKCEAATAKAHPSLRSAFTLVEVVLALIIAVGILLVLMFFYHQASNLRVQMIEETDRLSAIRLVMDLVTSELRTTRVDPAFSQAFIGRSNSIQFIKTDLPSFASWTGGALGRGPSESDLKLVRYQLEFLDATNVSGLLRSEEPLLEARSHTTSLPSESEQTSILEELIEEIRFLQFRYWNGVQWLDSWRSSIIPRGIEISLGTEPPELHDAESDSYDGSQPHVFRRVVALPVENVRSLDAPLQEFADDEMEGEEDEQ
jgi:type II secretory pathway pseudopilin PulG